MTAIQILFIVVIIGLVAVIIYDLYKNIKQ